MEFTFNKVANLQPVTLVITNSTMGVFLEIFQVFQSNYSVGHLWIAAFLTHFRSMLHSYRNHSTDLAWKPIDWFLHESNISLTWVKFHLQLKYFLLYVYYHYFDHFWLPRLYTIKSAVFKSFPIKLDDDSEIEGGGI